MIDDALLKQAGQRLTSWPRTMILTHARPDGDALGSIGAMVRVIASSGRQATPFIYEPLLPRYSFMQVAGDFATWSADQANHFDGILITDTCSWSQLEPVAGFLRESSLPRIIVDHHATRDDLRGRDSDDLYVIDSSGASACGLIHRWCEVMDWPIDAAAGEALLTGITTDTGWLRFSNTDAATLRSAAALVDQGVAPHRLYGQLFETRSAARLRLKALVLGTLELHANDSLAVMQLTKEMLAQAGATPGDSEELVNEPMDTGSVCVSVLLTDLGEGRIRANLRSKAPEVCGRDVDVAAIAKQFNGGGHRRAAGAWLPEPLAAAKQQMISTILTELNK